MNLKGMIARQIKTIGQKLNPFRKKRSPSVLKCFPLILAPEQIDEIAVPSVLRLGRGKTLQLENATNPNVFVYCTIGDVIQQGEPDVAFIPTWMMERLEIEEGDGVKFSQAELPKGTFVQFKPMSSAFLGIPMESRQHILEFQLKRYHTLTEGTIITISNELNTYSFRVLKCEPEKSIRITDIDLATDFTEPEDFEEEYDPQQGQAQKVELDQIVRGTIPKGGYRHFVLLSLVGLLPCRICVEVTANAGDPDLFLCQEFNAPSRERYTWCCQDDGDVSIEVGRKESSFDPSKPLYAGVSALLEEADFAICFKRSDTSAAARAISSKLKGQSLRGTTSDGTDGPTKGSVNPGDNQCCHCGTWMTPLKLVMHESHCSQLTFCCSLCRISMPKHMKEKHAVIFHEDLYCSCGVSLPQVLLHEHQKQECFKRPVKCFNKWCRLSFPFNQLQHHEEVCAQHPANCPICEREKKSCDLESHMETEHGVDTKDLDWQKPLKAQLKDYLCGHPVARPDIFATPHSETERKSSCPSPGGSFSFFNSAFEARRDSMEARRSSQDSDAAAAVAVSSSSPVPSSSPLRCACGREFFHEDDLQVHQLTDCQQKDTFLSILNESGGGASSWGGDPVPDDSNEASALESPLPRDFPRRDDGLGLGSSSRPLPFDSPLTFGGVVERRHSSSRLGSMRSRGPSQMSAKPVFGSSPTVVGDAGEALAREHGAFPLPNSGELRQDIGDFGVGFGSRRQAAEARAPFTPPPSHATAVGTYECSCGKTFPKIPGFVEDVQLHQLTDCPNRSRYEQAAGSELFA